MRTKRSVLGTLTLATAFLILCSTRAKAASVNYLFTGDVDMGANSSFTGSVAIPQFDPSLGILNSVTFSFVSGYESQVAVTGPDGATANFSAVETSIFHDAGNNINASIGNNWAGSLDLPDYTHGGSSSPGSTTATYNSAIVLTELTGLGTFSLAATGNQHISALILPAGVDISITDGTFGTHGSVTYDYTAAARAPDAANSVVLLAMSFGLLLFLRKAFPKIAPAKR